MMLLFLSGRTLVLSETLLYKYLQPNPVKITFNTLKENKCFTLLKDKNVGIYTSNILSFHKCYLIKN